MATTRREAAQPSGAFPAPPGVTPDLENPEDNLYTANVVGLAVCNGFIFAFFVLRCCARYSMALPKTSEDWACQVAFGLSILYIATCYMMARHGEGHHAWEVTPENYRQLLKWLYASSIVWIPAAFAVKASLLLLTARVFAVYQRVAKAIRLYIWFILLAYLPIQFVKIFICTPIKHYWDPRVPGRCLDQPKIFLTDTAIAFVTDFLILIIPIPLTWKLRMPLRRKMKIVAMLGAGGCAVAVACYREYKIYVFQKSTDVSGDFVIMNLCGTIELTIGMVCACLPPINLLIERWRSSKPSRNQTRAGFLPSLDAWKRRVTSQTTETPGLSTTLEGTRNREGDGNTALDDVETGSMNEARETQRPHPRNEDDEADDLHHLDLAKLLKYDSEDARREGWLMEEANENEIRLEEDLTMHRAQVTMEQLRQDARDVLIPDRIWDGVRRDL
ncbi:Satratoxin biosynthesis SC22 cluster protein [Paramyrothecium foliicola]|nr:Satratoxin biosynthesis SC22 cluster protein [Paramyrothecium foliicola]